MKMMRESEEGCGRPRTRSTTTLWSLPEELLLHLLHGLHVRDLLSLRSTHPGFRDLIDDNSSVWTHSSFLDIWPSQKNLRHFERASKESNIEALIKLGIAHLYNEGLPGDFEGRKIFSNSEKAAQLFCRVESLTPSVDPFTWLFFRPPWSINGHCCKQWVFNNMKQYVTQHSDASVEVCIAKTLELLVKTGGDRTVQEMNLHLDSAISHGSSYAAYLRWKSKFNKTKLDKSVELESLRELRDVAQSGSLEAQLQLCMTYGEGRYGGYSPQQAASYVSDFIQKSTATNTHKIFCNKEFTHSMRYILVDWLVEVADMKDFSSLPLHMAVSVVDRYLHKRPVTRSKLQLVGVAAMVLCSRLLDEEILTIREAAWLTDNTYKYEDVVRTMGEITAALHGTLRVLTSVDYVRVVGVIAGNDCTTQYMSEYLCELCLLYTDLSHYTQSMLAAACVLLARLTQHKDCPWSSNLQTMTGYSTDDLKKCAVHIHETCFVKNTMVDHRNVTLQAVKVRYSGAALGHVSCLTMLDIDCVRRALGMSNMSSLLSHFDGSKVIVKQDSIYGSAATKNLITSPCRPHPGSKNLITSPCRPHPGSKNLITSPCRPHPGSKNLITSPCRPCPSVKNLIKSPCRPHPTTKNLITSPSDPRPTAKKSMHMSSMVSGMDTDREQAATPTPTHCSPDTGDNHQTEPYVNLQDYDFDLESVWCAQSTSPQKLSSSPHRTASLSSGKYSILGKIPSTISIKSSTWLAASSQPNTSSTLTRDSKSSKPATVTSNSLANSTSGFGDGGCSLGVGKSDNTLASTSSDNSKTPQNCCVTAGTTKRKALQSVANGRQIRIGDCQKAKRKNIEPNSGSRKKFCSLTLQ